MPGFIVPTPTDREDQYPDPIGVRGLIWASSAISTGPVTLIPQQPSADWAWLAVTRPAGGAAAQTGIWTVQWHHDPSGLLTVATDTIVVPPASAVDVCLPVKAPYFTVLTVSATGAGTYPSGGAWRLGSYPAAHYQARRDVLIDEPGGSILNGVTKTYTAGYVTNGTCRINVTGSGAVAWRATATCVDNTGATRQLWAYDSGAAEGHADGAFHLPPWPLTVNIQNRDAVARNYWMAVSVGP